MTAINRYILAEFARTFGFTMIALVGIFWLSQAIRLIDTILLKGGGAGPFFRLSVYLLPEVIVNIAPLAALIGILFSMNRMAQDAELLVPVASGRNPMANLKPTLFAGLVLALIVALMSIMLVPKTRFWIKSELYVIGQNYNKNFISSKEFVGPIEGLVIYAEESELTGEMLNVFISDQRDLEVIREYYADRALLSIVSGERNVALIEGQAHERDRKSGALSVSDFARFEVSLGPVLALEDVTSNAIDRQPTRDLITDWQASDYQDNKILAELSQRYGIPLLAFLMPTIGMLAFIKKPYSRAGHRTEITLAIVFGILCQIAVIGAKSAIVDDRNAILVLFVPVVATLVAILIIAQRAEAMR